MNSIIKFFVIMLFPFLLSAQDELKNKITWGGNLIGEYLPNLYSNWNTTAVGGQIYINYKHSDDLFSTLNGFALFVPVTNNTIDYSALRSFSLAFSYNPNLLTHLNPLMSIGISYTRGKISLIDKEYAGVFAQLKTEYILNEKIAIFTSFNGIYDFSNQNITSVLRIGFKASFIIISFDISQYIKWENPESRLNNSLTVPHLRNHSF